MRHPWKTLCLAAVVSVGCLMTAAPASADPPRNRYERRAEKHSHYRRGQQRRSGRSHPGGGSYSNRRDYGRRPAAPGIPPHLVDMDSDGIPNLRDRDQDGDGVPNHRDRYPRDERRR